MKRKINYICFFSEPADRDRLVSYPSVWSKIEYIKDTLIELGYSVDIISAAPIRIRGFYKGSVININTKEKHKYFNSFKTGIGIIDKLNTLYIYVQLLLYLLAKPKDEYILVYHSLFYDNLIKLIKKVFKRKFILEIEDVYSSLTRTNNKYSVREWDYFSQAESYLTVNDIIAEELHNDKKKIISYGRYTLPQLHEKNSHHEKIRLIYAGVIEQERKGAFLAVEAMNYLTDEYELYICGFGNDEDINAIQKKINKVNDKIKRKAVIYLGYKSGVEYEEILQSCDIALSTHTYDNTNMSSADHTFPSKLLVYLGNGLRIVAQRLKVLEQSQIADLIYFYDYPTPNSLAETIMSIKLGKQYDGINRIKQLDEKFRIDMKKLL